MAISITSALTAVLSGLKKLDTSNWAKWQKGFRMFLLGLDALWVIEGLGSDAPTADQASLDRQIVPYLFSNVSEEYQYLVEDCDSAIAAWSALKAHFEKSNLTNRMLARKELHTVTHDPSKDIMLYFLAVLAAVQKLAALGVVIGEQEHTDIVLMNLDPAYSSARSVLLTRTEEPSLQVVKDVLTVTASSDPAIKLEDTTSGLAFAATTGRRPGHGGPSSHPTLTGTIGSHGFPLDSQGYRWCDPANNDCHRCGRVGHIAGKCMHSMPPFVKDWIMKNTQSTTPSAAFHAAFVAGLTPETFSNLYDARFGYFPATDVDPTTLPPHRS